MPPKKPPVSKSESKAKADPTDDIPLQAVVLADSYNSRFDVLCTETPRILLPLCGSPLLAWTLESLSFSRVKQVFVFCGAHADKIESYIENSPYSESLEIRCLRSQTARSAGDALRELDDMHVLNPENPFVLVHSPLISNYDISRMVDAHKRRREEDKNYIMTLGVGRGGRQHPESAIMLVHPPSSRLLHYAPQPLDPLPSRLSLPASLFLDPYPASIDTYEIWSGASSASSSRPVSSARGQGLYGDLGVDICEADVPALCTENFDWHDLRRHLVNGVLTSELLGKRIAVHLVGSQEWEDGDDQGTRGTYVERVRDTRTFSEISRDVLRRWAFPLTPDLNEPGTMTYELRPGNVYVAADNVVLSRSTSLNGPLLIGPRTALAQNTQVIQSTLGADCSVGPGTVIARSHLFDDVRVGANCHLEQCMVGRGVEIADGVVIGRGVLLGDGVRLEKGVRVPEFTRVGKERYVPTGEEDDPEPESESEKAERTRVLGTSSVGYIWPSGEEPASSSDSDSEPEDPDDPFDHPSNRRLLQLGRSLSRLSRSRQSDGSLSTLSQASDTPPDSPISSSMSLSDSLAMKGLTLDASDQPPPAFYSEARDSLQRAYEEDHVVEDALTEFRTLFMGYNAGVHRARREVVRFFMEQVEWGGGAAEVLKSAEEVWSRWGGFAAGLAGDKVNVILDAQEWAVSPPSAKSQAGQWFGLLLRALYESDTVSEDDLLDWRSLKAAKGEEPSAEEVAEDIERPGLWKNEEERARWAETWERGRRYVDALEEMSSDEEDEDEDEDED